MKVRRKAQMPVLVVHKQLWHGSLREDTQTWRNKGGSRTSGEARIQGGTAGKHRGDLCHHQAKAGIRSGPCDVPVGEAALQTGDSRSHELHL